MYFSNTNYWNFSDRLLSKRLLMHIPTTPVVQFDYITVVHLAVLPTCEESSLYSYYLPSSPNTSGLAKCPCQLPFNFPYSTDDNITLLIANSLLKNSTVPLGYF